MLFSENECQVEIDVQLESAKDKSLMRINHI